MLRLQTSSKNKKRGNGFTMIEVIVAITILTIGVFGMAFMIAGTTVTGTTARFTNMANVLASEKLDSLNRYPSTDPNVQPGGALTGATTCASTDIYCDMVTVNESSGADYETQTQVNADGTTVTSTIVHAASGCVDTPTNCSVSAAPAGGQTFTRRWMITMNPTIATSGGTTSTVTGYRRVTVVVTQNGSTTGQPVSFQMSMVRP
jgi:type IV pilus modification protein PilV